MNPFTMIKAPTGSNKRMKNQEGHNSTCFPSRHKRYFFVQQYEYKQKKEWRHKPSQPNAQSLVLHKVFPRSLSCRKMIWCHAVMLAHSAIRQQCNGSENMFKKANTETGLSFLCCIDTEISVPCQRDHKQKEVFQFHQYLIEVHTQVTNATAVLD